jgi:hypothetical protein
MKIIGADEALIPPAVGSTLIGSSRDASGLFSGALQSAKRHSSRNDWRRRVSVGGTASSWNEQAGQET